MQSAEARSQKFAIEGAVLGSGAKSPGAGGYWGSGGKTPSRWRHGGVGAEPPALENFALKKKQLSFRAILIKNNAFKTWHRNWLCKPD